MANLVYFIVIVRKTHCIMEKDALQNDALEKDALEKEALNRML